MDGCGKNWEGRGGVECNWEGMGRWDGDVFLFFNLFPTVHAHCNVWIFFLCLPGPTMASALPCTEKHKTNIEQNVN